MSFFQNLYLKKSEAFFHFVNSILPIVKQFIMPLKKKWLSKLPSKSEIIVKKRQKKLS